MEAVDILEFLCGRCEHAAKHHAGYTGPCAQCWREMVEICEGFRLKESDRYHPLLIDRTRELEEMKGKGSLSND